MDNEVLFMQADLTSVEERFNDKQQNKKEIPKGNGVIEEDNINGQVNDNPSTLFIVEKKFNIDNNSNQEKLNEYCETQSGIHSSLPQLYQDNFMSVNQEIQNKETECDENKRNSIYQSITLNEDLVLERLSQHKSKVPQIYTISNNVQLKEENQLDSHPAELGSNTSIENENNVEDSDAFEPELKCHEPTEDFETSKPRKSILKKPKSYNYLNYSNEPLISVKVIELPQDDNNNVGGNIQTTCWYRFLSFLCHWRVRVIKFD